MKILSACAAIIALIGFSPINAQTRTNCRWVGSVWTCDQSEPPRIDWGTSNNSGNSAGDSFRRGVELGEQARRAKLERERLKLEQDRLTLDRAQLEQRKAETQTQRQSLPAEPPNYGQRWLEKARPRMGLFPNFAKVVFESDVTITPDMVMLMSSSDYAADIAYFLGTHKAELLAIAQLPLLDAARALSDIEERIKADLQSKASPDVGADKPQGK